MKRLIPLLFLLPLVSFAQVYSLPPGYECADGSSFGCEAVSDAPGAPSLWLIFQEAPEISVDEAPASLLLLAGLVAISVGRRNRHARA